MIVVLLHAEFHPTSGNSVSKTKLCSFYVPVLQLFQQLVRMLTDTAEHVANHFRSISRFAFKARELRFNGTRKGFVGDSKRNFLFLGGLWKIHFEQRNQILRG